ncbi:MAG: RNA-binding transcriptional accessory protein, partial [Psychrobium sp.]|nr:RNA-binding transcriptional accessory protein [Psychrobium sp.]
MQSIINTIAHELSVPNQSVKAAISLLDDGASVPFIARYRKEKTQGLDDVQLRNLHKRLSYLRELNARKDTISRSIDELGKLSHAIKHAIEQCDSKSELEELYKPFKSKRQSKGQLAIEAGLAPLAQLLLTQPNQLPQRQAKAFVKRTSHYDSVANVLAGASDILSEQFATDVALVKNLRQQIWQRGDIN